MTKCFWFILDFLKSTCGSNSFTRGFIDGLVTLLYELFILMIIFYYLNYPKSQGGAGFNWRQSLPAYT
jgi:hypothetical protein